MILQGRSLLVFAENTHRFRAPSGESRRDSVTHKKIETFSRRGNRFIHRLESGRRRHLDSGNKIGDHAIRAKNGRSVQNASNPFIAPDVSGFARSVELEQTLVPDFEIRVVHLHTRIA
jgi:hypothetical protein